MAPAVAKARRSGASSWSPLQVCQSMSLPKRGAARRRYRSPCSCMAKPRVRRPRPRRRRRGRGDRARGLARIPRPHHHARPLSLRDYRRRSSVSTSNASTVGDATPIACHDSCAASHATGAGMALPSSQLAHSAPEQTPHRRRSAPGVLTLFGGSLVREHGQRRNQNLDACERDAPSKALRCRRGPSASRDTFGARTLLDQGRPR